MSQPVPFPSAGSRCVPEPTASGRSQLGMRADLTVAARLAGALAVLGAVLGFAWSAWSGPQQRAYVIAPHELYPFDEAETFVASDGRFLVITVAVGVLAAILAWLRLPGHRGPAVVLALGLGGLGGAGLTDWVGHLTGGGTFAGKPGTVIAHLPLSLHLPGLLFLEPAFATMGYGLFTAFAARDDLGRPDPVADRRLVGAGDQAQGGGGDGDASGAPQ